MAETETETETNGASSSDARMGNDKLQQVTRAIDARPFKLTAYTARIAVSGSIDSTAERLCAKQKQRHRRMPAEASS